MSYQQILLSNRLVILFSDLDQNSTRSHQLDLIQYSVNLNRFKLVSSKQTTVGANPPKDVFITSAKTAISVKQVDNIHPEFTFQEITSHNSIDYTGALQTATFTDFKQLGSFFAIYGGGLIDNSREPLLDLIFISNNYARIVESNTSLSNLDVIYNIAISDTTIYISASELVQGQQIFPILSIQNVIRPSMFLDNINPGLQLNILSVPLMILYVTVIYWREHQRKKIPYDADLSYPSNNSKD